MPLTQAEVDALRNATRAYGGTVEVVPRAQYAAPEPLRAAQVAAAQGTPLPNPARAAQVAAAQGTPVQYVDPIQAQFDALAANVAARGAAAPVSGGVAPVVREGVQGPPNYYNVPGAAEAQALYGVPPMMFQRDPYATAGFMAGPDGSVQPLVGYPSRYPHVLNGVPQNYAAPYLANAWGMLGPWLAPPNPAAVQSLVDAARAPRPAARQGGGNGGSSKSTAKEEKNPLMGPNAGPQRVAAPAAAAPAQAAPAVPAGPQYTQGDVFDAALMQSRSPYVRDVGQFDYDEYGNIVPGDGYDVSLGSTASYPDPYARLPEVRAPFSREVQPRVSLTPAAPQEGLSYDALMMAVDAANRAAQSEAAAPLAEVRAPLVPDVRGAYGQEARGALVPEVRGTYGQEVRGAMLPSILYNGQLANLSNSR